MVSLSLGDTCVFRFGNTETRTRPYTDVELRSGDLFVFGGPSRLAYHGVPRVHPGHGAARAGADRTAEHHPAGQRLPGRHLPNGSWETRPHERQGGPPAGGGRDHLEDAAGPGARRARARAGARAHRPRAHPRRAHRRTRRDPRDGRRGRRRAGGARPDQGRRPAERRRRFAGPPLAPARRSPSDGPVVLAAQVHADGFRAALVGLGGRIVATAPGCETVDADPAQGARRRRRGRRRAAARDRPALRRRRPRRAVRGRRTRGHSRSTRCTSPGRRARPCGRSSPSGSAAGRASPAPAFAGNDVNLAALAEHRHGAGRGARDLLCVATGHRGVGGALVLDGRLHTGSSGLALEVGHLTVNPEGRPCHCGSRGCLDVEADPLAFLTAAGREPGPEVLPAPAGQRPDPRRVRRPGRSGPPPRPSSTGSASGSPGWSTSSTPTASSSAACTARCWTPTPSGCARSSPTAACGAAAAASPSWPAPSTTTAWSARPSWRGSRCWTIRWGR